jgi:glyoxylase-like metal-dependent hydrolase (beta-lactamase superfamily II)
MSKGPAIILPGETEIDIYVTGTCTAGPGENIFDVLGEIDSGKRKIAHTYWGRPVSGEGTVAMVRHKPNRGQSTSFFVGLGGFKDTAVFRKSYGKYGIPTDLKGGIVLHTHPDHISFIDTLKTGKLPVYKSAADKTLPAVLDHEIGPNDPVYKQLFSLYGEHRDIGMKPHDFTPIDPDYPEICWLLGNIILFPTPGHSESGMAMFIDGPVVVRNYETGEESRSKSGAVIEDDNLCDSRYAFEALKGLRKKSTYDLSGFDPPISDSQKDIESQNKILNYASEKNIIVPGHGLPFTIHDIKENPPNFKTTYVIDF